jgi:PAS domain S-box-containing protein
MLGNKQKSEIKPLSIIEVIPTAYLFLNKTGHIKKVNYYFRSSLGYSNEEILSKKFQEIVATKDFIFSDFFKKIKTSSSKEIRGVELKLIHKNGQISYFLLNVLFLQNTLQCTLFDVSDKMFGGIRDLLERLIPICANCKRVKAENERWEYIESFLGRKIKVRFSHGICPECHETIYKPELQKLKECLSSD